MYHVYDITIKCPKCIPTVLEEKYAFNSVQEEHRGHSSFYSVITFVMLLSNGISRPSQTTVFAPFLSQHIGNVHNFVGVHPKNPIKEENRRFGKEKAIESVTITAF